MPTFRRLIAFLAAAAAASTLGVAALVGAGTAGAISTDDMFVEVLADEGIEVPSTREAVSLALDVCATFDEGHSLYDVVDAVSDYTELATEDSAFIVGASVGAYCPEHEVALG
jgi:hypothetical protein